MTGFCLLCSPRVHFYSVDSWADHEALHVADERRRRLAASRVAVHSTWLITATARGPLAAKAPA